VADSSTGFSDLTFDLVSVQYHALKAGQTYDQYIDDARKAGQDEVVQFFQQLQQQDAERAQRCHDLLRAVTSG